MYDTARKQLYVLDSIPEGRAKRAKAAALAWRVHLVNLGFGGDFSCAAPAIRPQTRPWACGYIAAVNVLLVVRGLSDPSTRDAVSWQGTAINNVRLDGGFGNREDPNNHPYHYVLPYPDWGFGAPTSVIASVRVKTVLAMIACNELGIQSSAELQSMGPEFADLGINAFVFERASADLASPYVAQMTSATSWGVWYNMVDGRSYSPHLVEATRLPPLVVLGPREPPAHWPANWTLIPERRRRLRNPAAWRNLWRSRIRRTV